MTFTDPIQAMYIVVNVLESLKIAYYIGGSLSSSIHGIPRSTQVVDLVADIRVHQISEFVSAFTDDFYVDGDMIREALQFRSSFNIIHLESMTKVDIFIFKNSPFGISEMSRRRKEKIESESGPDVYFSSPEDIILEKLLWFKQGGEVSDRQWGDILGVIKVQGDRLDKKYLSAWAKKHGISNLLNSALIQK